MTFHRSSRSRAASTQAPVRPRPLPPRLPPALAGLHRFLCDRVEALPSAPPSFLAAQVLNRRLLPRLPQDVCEALRGRVVALHVTDLGLRVRLRLGQAGLAPAADEADAHLCIRAPLGSYLRLAHGEDDPDRLFFSRELVMEGDTELGLVLKNALDAIGPWWRGD